MAKTKNAMLPEWIGPLEASLEMSIRRGIYISPDDIKQLRNKKRLPEGSYLTVSNRSTIYQRQTIRDFQGLKKREVVPIGKDLVVNWLWEFPKTIQALEQEGYNIPHKEEALIELEQQRENKQKNPNPKRINKPA